MQTNIKRNTQKDKYDLICFIEVMLSSYTSQWSIGYTNRLVAVD